MTYSAESYSSRTVHEDDPGAPDPGTCAVCAEEWIMDVIIDYLKKGFTLADAEAKAQEEYDQLYR